MPRAISSFSCDWRSSGIAGPRRSMPSGRLSTAASFALVARVASTTFGGATAAFTAGAGFLAWGAAALPRSFSRALLRAAVAFSATAGLAGLAGWTWAVGRFLGAV